VWCSRENKSGHYFVAVYFAGANVKKSNLAAVAEADAK
jgi:hypothetical protein